jgi:RNA polymerase-binding protein DksA
MPGASRKQTTARRATSTKSKAKSPAKSRAGARPTKKKASPAAKSRATKPAKTTKKALATSKSAKSTAKVAKPAKGAVKPAKKAAAPKTSKAVKATKAQRTPPPAKAPPARPMTTSGPPRAKAGKSGKKIVVCELSGFEVTPSVPGLSPKTLERLREKLTEEKKRLLHQAEELSAEAEQLASDREAGDTQFDEESGEGDTVNVERERDLLLSATARQVVEEIDEALARVKKGSYGVCKYAGRKLPLERLEAIPWASVCVDCKARAERRR